MNSENANGERGGVFRARMSRLTNLALMACIAASLVSARNGADGVRTVRSVIVRGNEVTQERVILREMLLRPGDHLDERQLERDRDRIYSLQLFNKVEVRVAGGTDSVDVVVDVVERWYFFPHPVFGFKDRNVDKMFYGAGISNNNFRGRNEKLSASLVFGYDRWASVAYQTPRLTDDGDIYLRTGVSYRLVHNPGISGTDYDQQNSSISLSFGKRFGLYRNLIATMGYDRWYVGEPIEGRTVAPDGKDEFASFALFYNYDSRNIREYATDGSSFTLLMGKSGFGSSDVNLFSYGMEIRHFIPVGIASAAALKAYGSLVAGGPVPAYRHVYLGFENKLRGYFRDKFEGDDIVGVSAEMRLAVIPPTFATLDFIPWKQFNTIRYGVYLAAFADAGKIWYQSAGIAAAPTRSGFGVGLHWLFAYSFVLRTEVAMNNAGREEFILDFGASF